MFSAREFRKLVSGEQRGAGAAILRCALRAAEVPYTAAVNWRNRRYDRNNEAVRRVGVPVISVGNLTLGGTGKTPMVKWLARWIGERGIRVAIASRGYGADAGQPNDEAKELAASLPDVPHVQNADRVAAAERAIRDFNAQLILLDDGFQHRRLGRDLDIVLLDALEPFGFNHVFPRGTLREPMSSLKRADAVCLSRADTIKSVQRESIRCQVNEISPRAVWCEVTHAARGLINAAGETQPLDALAERKIAAFCGIGNPIGFRHTLAGVGCEIVAWREFPDHHRYREGDMNRLREILPSSGAEIAVCTQKDLVKLRLLDIGGVPLWAMTIEMQLLSGENALQTLLYRVASAAIQQPPAEPAAKPFGENPT